LPRNGFARSDPLFPAAGTPTHLLESHEEKQAVESRESIGD
jgi:hypothetical protein